MSALEVVLAVVAGIIVYCMGAGITHVVTEDKGFQLEGDRFAFSVAWGACVPISVAFIVGRSFARAPGRVAKWRRNRKPKETAKPTDAGEYRSRPCPECGK